MFLELKSTETSKHSASARSPATERYETPMAPCGAGWAGPLAAQMQSHGWIPSLAWMPHFKAPASLEGR